MSFSFDIKQEIANNINYKNKDLLKAFLVGYIISGNSTIASNSVEFLTENEFNIEALYKILFNLKLEYEPEIRGKTFVAKFSINEGLEVFLDLLNSGNEDVQKSIIKGTFLGSGSINDPSKQTHLEIAFTNQEYSKKLIDICSGFGVDFKQVKYGEDTGKLKYIIYLKDTEKVSIFLALLGANKGVLNFEDARIIREMKNNVNRKVNCETANINRVVNASVDQVNDIKLIQKMKKFDEMPQDLKEIAMLRLDSPESSLKELGELLNPPLGKSGVNHRLKKIHEIAEELRK